jgi:hypothetical protein
MSKDNIFVYLSLLIILIYGIFEYFYPGKYPFFDATIGWLVALFIAINYLKKNRKDNQIAKKEELRKNLEIDAFREINKSITVFSNAISSVSSFYRALYSLKIFMFRKNPTIFKFDRIKIFQEMRSENNILMQGLLKFLSAIESNEIVVIQFDYLRKYIQFQLDDVNDKINNFESYFNKIEEKNLISEDGYIEFKEKCDEIIEQFTNIQSYLFDYRIILMNSLLSDIFDAKVPMRTPNDKKYKLLTEVAIKEEVEKEATKREEIFSKPNVNRVNHDN